MKNIQDDLPALYAKFFPSFFQLQVPEETFSTCTDCAMVCKKENKSILRPFLPDRKCCTYHPDIPGYLIGGLLSDPDPLMGEGKKRVRERIKNKIGVSPAGIYAPKIYRVIYKNGSSFGFGHSENLLCPYFERKTGGCTVWKYRDKTCSTYFCKTVGNKTGEAFWDSLKQYLSFIQGALIQYTLMQLDISSMPVVMEEMKPVTDKTRLTVEDLDYLPPTENNYKKLWAEWEGREEEFFKRSYELVNQLNEEQFNSIAGIQQQILLKDMKGKRQKMVSIPEKLKKNERISLTKSIAGTYTIVLPAIDVSFELPAFLIDCFEGSKTNQEISEYLSEKEGVELDTEILLALYQHGILVKAK